MLYKIKNGLIDIDSHQYIQANDSRTRGKNRLYQERTSSEAFGNSFFPKTIRDWNQLPANTTPAARENFAQCRATQQSSTDYLQVKLYTDGSWSSCCQDARPELY
jgi:hypothetical protein